MSNPDVCIACLSSNIKMHCLANTQVYEFFVKITNNKLSKLNEISDTMCYLCYSQLQKCCRFIKMTQKAEVILMQLLSDKVKITQETLSALDERTSYVTIIQQSSFINSNKSVKDEEVGRCTDKGVFIDSQVPENEILITVKEEPTDTDDQMSIEDGFLAIKHEPIEPLDNNQESRVQGNNEHDLELNESKILKDLNPATQSQIENNIVASETSPKSQTFEDLALENDTNTKFPITLEVQHIKEVVYLKDHKTVTSESVKMEMEDSNDKTDTENNETYLKERPDENLCEESSSVSLKGKSKTNVFSVKEAHVCSTCGKIFHSPYHLRRHLVTHTGEKRFVCKICNKKFSQKVHLTQHQIKVHTKKETSGEKQYFCELCDDKAFCNKNSYRMHLKRHSGVRLENCTLCSSSFVNKGDLKRHMRTHTGEKPYTCNVCESSFRQNCHLTEHMRVHVKKEKKYVCDFCQETFVKKCELNKHIAIHTANCYACPYDGCTKSFRSRVAVGLHSRVHTGEPYSCEICNKSFKQRKNLTIHRKAHVEETD